MLRYRPLLDINVRHGFYADASCPGLRFMPTPETQALVARMDAVVLTTPQGITVLAEDHCALNDLTEDHQALIWMMGSEDPAFPDYTAGLGQPRQSLLYFDAKHATSSLEDGHYLLRPVEAAAADVLGRPALQSTHSMSAVWGLGGYPCGVVRIPLSALSPRAAAPMRFVLRLAPRATVWKYCLVGAWTEPSLHVVDLAQEIEFAPAPTRRLVDGRAALVFRSNAAIALQQRPNARFQLRSRGDDGARAHARSDKVVVKRLPAAAPRHFSREVIGGASALVSEIFVHR